MPALAHIGIGLAVKRFFPKIPLWGLLISVMTIDILSFIFISAIWISHSFFMAMIWSINGTLITAIVTFFLKTKKKRNIKILNTSIIIFILVFSHWVLDFIGWPMSVINPNLNGVPILFDDTLTVGLGVYSTWLGALLMDIGVFLIGLAIYIHFILRVKKQ
ncbi:MAG: hypothetical protein ACFE8G_00735 [Candidatus Hermodarchaeota archaeon]